VNDIYCSGEDYGQLRADSKKCIIIIYSEVLSIEIRDVCEEKYVTFVCSSWLLSYCVVNYFSLDFAHAY